MILQDPTFIFSLDREALGEHPVFVALTEMIGFESAVIVRDCCFRVRVGTMVTKYINSVALLRWMVLFPIKHLRV